MQPEMRSHWTRENFFAILWRASEQKDLND
jgi:hypothetical protein